MPRGFWMIALIVTALWALGGCGSGAPASRPAGANQADGTGTGAPRRALEVLETRFEPLVAGKNIVHVQARNPLADGRVIGVHIQTRSPGANRGRGMGWGRPYFRQVEPGATASWRLAFRIYEPLSDGTSIRLRFYSVASAEQYDFTAAVEEQTYTAAKLARRAADARPAEQASQEQAQAILAAFERVRSHLRDGRYADAAALFTQDYRDVELMERLPERAGAEGLRKLLETDEGITGFWLKSEFLSLQPREVLVEGGMLYLQARRDDQLWNIIFALEQGQWKIDSISGFRSVAAGWADWQERLLPKMQKHDTQILDIYCFADSTAARQIDQIAEHREAAIRAICDFLGCDMPGRIRLVLFENHQRKYRETGHQGDGWATGRTMVEVYNEQTRLNPYHETTHIAAKTLGNPPALLREGLAVYLSERLGAPALVNLGGDRQTLDERCRKLMADNEWIELKVLMTYTEIGSRHSKPALSYPLAGGFVKFLIERKGKDEFLEAYRKLRSSSDPMIQQENTRAIEQTLGKGVQELEAEWQAALRKGLAQAAGQ